MQYRNTEMKLDQLVGYLNEEKINLSPAFQRGHVWPVTTRRKLIANIVKGRPIPAIFLYKEAEAQRYSYNILDGKQRLESIMLFIGDNNVGGLGIKTWSKYFFQPRLRKQMGFWINLQSGRKTTFTKLTDDTLRDLREYSIPTVEITLSESSRLDEIISLFVDINQQGVKVARFDIVKAMGKNNALLSSVFDLIAIQERRAQDTLYKAKSNVFTKVLRRLDVIADVPDANAQVDRMWERLLEIALFEQSRRHRKPIDILKSFIRQAPDTKFPALTVRQRKHLREVFNFLAEAYKESGLAQTPFAKDPTHFYTITTTLIASDVITTMPNLASRLARIGRMIATDTKLRGSDRETFDEYMNLSMDRTTDTPRREQRQRLLMDLLNAVR